MVTYCNDVYSCDHLVCYDCGAEQGQCNCYFDTRSLGDRFKCGGHATQELREAAAKEAVAKLINSSVINQLAVAMPTGGFKIQFYSAPRVELSFSTTSELRDALLASYPDATAGYFDVPLVQLNRENEAVAWHWVPQLIRTRSDWWPALGIALQHAFTDGGKLAQTAFCDFVAGFNRSIVLYPWTAPVAERFPGVHARTTGTGWGSSDLRLDSIMRDQAKYLKEAIEAGRGSVFVGMPWGGEYVLAGQPHTWSFKNEADMRALLEATAKAGRFPNGDSGPWTWLVDELLQGEPWVRPAFMHIVETIDDKRMVHALLDYFFEEQDLWRFVPLLQRWFDHHPAWWDEPAKSEPSGWKYNMRSAHWPEVETLGDVARQALYRAQRQVLTPPVLDLPLLYGPSIS